MLLVQSLAERHFVALFVSGSVHLSLLALFMMLSAHVPQLVSSTVELSIVENHGRAAPPAIATRRPRAQATLPLPTLPDHLEKPLTLNEPEPQPSSTAGLDEPTANETLIRYESEIARLLNSRKQYPEVARRLRHQGRVKIRFKLQRDGRLLSYDVIEESAHASLNEAARKLMRDFSGFTPFPQETRELTWVFTVPIEYRM